MNYLHANVIDSFSNLDLKTEIHLMQDQLDEIMEHPTHYYHKGECFFSDEIDNLSSYLTLLEKEWLKRHDDFVTKRYHNVNQFLN